MKKRHLLLSFIFLLIAQSNFAQPPGGVDKPDFNEIKKKQEVIRLRAKAESERKAAAAERARIEKEKRLAKARAGAIFQYYHNNYANEVYESRVEGPNGTFAEVKTDEDGTNITYYDKHGHYDSMESSGSYYHQYERELAERNLNMSYPKADRDRDRQQIMNEKIRDLMDQEMPEIMLEGREPRGIDRQ